MSGSLSFITSDPVTPAYESAVNFRNKQRDYQEGQDTDAAIRSGISDMLGANQPPHPLLGPNAVPTSQALPSATAGAPNPPPDAPPTFTANPDPNSWSTTLSNPTLANVKDSWADATQSVEDPSGTTVNADGYAGKYQFGAPALMAAGAYTPAAGENLNANEWKGQITLPGRAPMTMQQFLLDGGAQDQAMRMHQDNLDRQIAARGLDRYIGTQVNGQTVTRPMLYSLMHFGGPTGAEKYLQSGGGYDPTDANSTSTRAYTLQVTRRMQEYGQPQPYLGPQQQPQPYLGPQQQPQMIPAAYQGGSDRYNPVLARLAQTPGGGATAMKILGEQAQLDRYTGQRQEQYQHLAMMAFARGDTDVGNYYAKIGGLNIPPQVLQNNGMRQRMATAALTAQRLYKDDPEGAQRFTQAYMLTGDVNQALSIGGEPKQKAGKLQTQWVQDPDDPTGAATLVQIDPTGQKPPQAVLGPDSQPLRQAPLRQGAPRVTWTQNGGTIVGVDGVARPITTADGQPITKATNPQQTHLRPIYADLGDGKQTLLTLNTGTGEVSRPQLGGQGVVKAPPRPSNLELKQKLLVQSGMYTPEEAAAVVAGAAPKPGSIGKSYQQLTQTMLNVDPKKIETDLPNIMTQMWGPDWRQKMVAEGQGMPGGARQAAAPAAAPGTPQQGIAGGAGRPATQEEVQGARQAIARGANRQAIIQRFMQNGVQPPPGI